MADRKAEDSELNYIRHSLKLVCSYFLYIFKFNLLVSLPNILTLPHFQFWVLFIDTLRFTCFCGEIFCEFTYRSLVHKNALSKGESKSLKLKYSPADFKQFYSVICYLYLSCGTVIPRRFKPFTMWYCVTVTLCHCASSSWQGSITSRKFES